MTLEEFRETGRDCDDLGEAVQDDCLAGVKGRLYGDSLYIMAYPDHDWFVPMMGLDYIGPDLAEAESRLFGFCRDEGYFA